MKKGTSNKPVILGVLGFLTALPNAIISLLSSSFVVAYSSEPMSNSEAIDFSFFYMKLIFWSALIGFLFSLFAKRLYMLVGIIMLLCGTLIFISMVTANFFLIFPSSFFILGGIFCFTQKKTIPISTNNTISNQRL